MSCVKGLMNKGDYVSDEKILRYKNDLGGVCQKHKVERSEAECDSNEYIRSIYSVDNIYYLFKILFIIYNI